MLSKSILTKLNEQISKELYSSYLYLAMSCDCNARSLVGFGAWLRAQSSEEYGHAMKIMEFIEARQGTVSLTPINKPPVKFESVPVIFSEVLEHEQTISASINDIYKLAQKENDYATQTFLNWFVSEQVEEEATASLIVDKLKMIGASAGSLLYLDKEMGKRQKAA